MAYIKPTPAHGNAPNFEIPNKETCALMPSDTAILSSQTRWLRIFLGGLRRQ